MELVMNTKLVFIWILLFGIVVGGLYWKVKKNFGKKVVITLIVFVVGFYPCNKLLYMQVDNLYRQEYLNGHTEKIIYKEAWTEKRVSTKTYTTSSGKTKTKKVVRYVRHSAEYYYETTLGINTISRSEYKNSVSMNNLNPKFKNLVRFSQSSVGDGNMYWDYIEKPLANKHTYIDYVSANNYSLYSSKKYKRALEKEVEKGNKIIEYPSLIRNNDGTTILQRIHDPYGIADSKVKYKINTFISNYLKLGGRRKEVNIFIYLLENQDQSIVSAYKAKYLGANKNDVIVFLNYKNGVNTWSDLIAQTKNEIFNAKIRLSDTNNKLSDLDKKAEEIVATIENDYSRKEMKDNKYLIHNLDIKTSYFIMPIIAILLLLGLVFLLEEKLH